MHDLLEQEDLKWRQRVKVEWLRNGDRNTKFFHACANQRNHRNHITKIIDGTGRSCIQPVEIERAFVDYFQTILTSDKPTAIEECIAGTDEKATPTMNQNLLADLWIRR